MKYKLIRTFNILLIIDFVTIFYWPIFLLVRIADQSKGANNTKPLNFIIT